MPSGVCRTMNLLANSLVAVVAVVSFVASTNLNLAQYVLPATYEIEPIKNQEKVEPQKGEIETLFEKVPETLWRIAYCETTIIHRNPKTNDTIRGVSDPRDTGLFQINKGYHPVDGLESLMGNTRYAVSLFKEQGARPWVWSYNPTTDQCKNGLKLPPRESEAWKTIKTEAINDLLKV